MHACLSPFTSFCPHSLFWFAHPIFLTSLPPVVKVKLRSNSISLDFDWSCTTVPLRPSICQTYSPFDILLTPSILRFTPSILRLRIVCICCYYLWLNSSS